MILSAIRERLAREPFEPFVIRGSSGESYPVPAPFLVALLKSEVFIATANSDRWVQIPYLHVAGLDSMNGHGKSSARRRRR